MKYLKIANSDLEVSRIALGLMRIGEKSVEQVEALVLKAVELGINFFDHADIYGKGMCESLFGEVLKRNPSLRDKIIIQTKCGIRPGYYDFSKEHIINSVEGSLKRLGIETIDVLLLHRPDTLMEVNEVKEAFDELSQTGKVRYFGVSNMNAIQMEYLQKNLMQKLLFNQLQFSIAHAGMVEVELNVNKKKPTSLDHDGHILGYCRLHDITIQPWSILQASWEEGTFLNHPSYPVLNEKLNELSEKYHVTPSAIATAWILRHPANMVPIAGTTSVHHLEELVEATEVELTKEEWYNLYYSLEHRKN